MKFFLVIKYFYFRTPVRCIFTMLLKIVNVPLVFFFSSRNLYGFVNEKNIIYRNEHLMSPVKKCRCEHMLILFAGKYATGGRSISKPRETVAASSHHARVRISAYYHHDNNMYSLEFYARRFVVPKTSRLLHVRNPRLPDPNLLLHCNHYIAHSTRSSIT